MTVSLDHGTIRLIGNCYVEDAEPVCTLLLADLSRNVDLSQALRLHTAVIQVLIALKPSILGEPDEKFQRDWIIPRLRGQGDVNQSNDG